jgi:hypothetical protein
MTTTPSGFTVPTVNFTETGKSGIYIQAVGDRSNASPGAWGYVRIWERPNDEWNDIFRHSGWEEDNVSQKERLKRAYDAAISENTGAGLAVFGNADPQGISLHKSIEGINAADVFKELQERLSALNSDQDFSKGSNDGVIAERLIWHLLGNRGNYQFQTTEGYDIECPQDHLHEVKSFQGNAEIRFTSAQLEKMNRQNYFIWLVKKTGTAIGHWEIYKLNGQDVFTAIQHLAKAKLNLGDNGPGNEVHLAVGVKFKLPPGNGDGNGITVCVGGNGNRDQSSVTLADVEPQDGNHYPLTANQWYESVQASNNGNPPKWWVNGDE